MNQTQTAPPARTWRANYDLARSRGEDKRSAERYAHRHTTRPRPSTYWAEQYSYARVTLENSPAKARAYADTVCPKGWPDPGPRRSWT